MQVDDGRQSDNVEDRRGVGGRVIAGGGIGALIIAVVVMFLGGDPRQVLDGGGSSGTAAPRSAEEEKLASFVRVVLADTEDVWRDQFQKMGRRYVDPELVLFTDGVDTACGGASAAVGPFYCPGDQKVYIDLSFYDELRRRFHAPGDFAQAYVIAHEIGHHVQNLLGITDRVQAQSARASRVEANRLSVRVELQADFFAGVWAHHAQRMRHLLEPGDIDEALTAAAAIGDDRLQKQARGRVVPDSFTLGASAQRVAWFRRGFDTGDVSKGDTFDEAVFQSVAAR